MIEFEEVDKIIKAYNRLLEDEVEGVNFGDDYKGTLSEKVQELEKRGIKGPLERVLGAYIEIQRTNEEFDNKAYTTLIREMRKIKQPEPTFDEDYDGRY